MAGKTISYNINGVYYNADTNKDGYASLTINLFPRQYIITAIYNGFMTSNRVTVYP